MNRPVIIDLFAEDKAHEEFLKPAVTRIARDLDTPVTLRTRSARGGHGRAIAEFVLYQTILKKNFLQITYPDMIVVAIDCNCRGLQAMERELHAYIHADFHDRTVLACPDPHIERWYLADVDAIRKVIGIPVKVPKKKCTRDFYKNLFAQTVVNAGHPSSLGGIEFAEEIVRAMDFYQAGKSEKSFSAFFRDITAALKRCVLSH